MKIEAQRIILIELRQIISCSITHAIIYHAIRINYFLKS